MTTYRRGRLRLTFRQKMWLPSVVVSICISITLFLASRLRQRNHEVLRLIETGHAPAVETSGDLEKLFAEPFVIAVPAPPRT